MHDDPRLLREEELRQDVIFAALDGDIDRANEANAELAEIQLDTLPEKGKARISFGSTVRETPPRTVHCDDCGHDVPTLPVRRSTGTRCPQTTR